MDKEFWIDPRGGARSSGAGLRLFVCTAIGLVLVVAAFPIGLAIAVTAFNWFIHLFRVSI